jgi:hypothetical protein
LAGVSDFPAQRSQDPSFQGLDSRRNSQSLIAKLRWHNRQSAPPLAPKIEFRQKPQFGVEICGPPRWNLAASGMFSDVP